MTMVMSSSLAGAEMITFFAPPAMCAFAAGPVTKRPVDSITMSTPRSPQGRLAGSRSARILIGLSPTTIVSPSTETGLSNRPATVSYFSRWAMVFRSPRSFAATTSKPRSPLSSSALKKFRPIRPNPLMPTRMVTAPVSVPIAARD